LPYIYLFIYIFIYLLCKIILEVEYKKIKSKKIKNDAIFSFSRSEVKAYTIKLEENQVQKLKNKNIYILRHFDQSRLIDTAVDC